MSIKLLIIGINVIGLIGAYILIQNFIEKRVIIGYSKKMQSYTQTKSWFDFLQHRYVEQLMLGEYIHIKELLVYYVSFIVGIVVIWFFILKASFILNMFFIFILILPIIILEQYRRIVSQKIDKGIFQFLTQINARLMKSEDIIKAISESEKSLTNKPLLYLVKQFNQTIKIGLPPERAFEKVQSQSLNEYLCYLFTNINIVYQRRGNVSELIKALENEYTSIQIEINKRKTELEHDRNMIGISLLIVFSITYKISIDNDYIISFYKMHNGIGLFFGLLVCIGVLFAVVGSIKKY